MDGVEGVDNVDLIVLEKEREEIERRFETRGKALEGLKKWEV